MESQNCSACSQINAAPKHKQRSLGKQLKGTLPFEHLEVNFTEMKPYWHYRYLLVIVCTFSSRAEAFPTRTKKANEVAHCLIREIIPRFGFPTSIASDNGPAFVADFIQQVCKALNIKWKLHTAYRPQSSGMVERTNQTLEETLSKWIIETNCSGMDLLPAALLILRVTPQSHSYSPYDGISQHMEQSGKVINQVTKFVQERVQFPLGEQIHEFVLGDQVWVKDWKHNSLARHWKGPYTVV